MRYSKDLVKTLHGYRGERTLLAGVSWGDFQGAVELKLGLQGWEDWTWGRALFKEKEQKEPYAQESHTSVGASDQKGSAVPRSLELCGRKTDLCPCAEMLLGRQIIKQASQQGPQEASHPQENAANSTSLGRMVQTLPDSSWGKLCSAPVEYQEPRSRILKWLGSQGLRIPQRLKKADFFPSSPLPSFILPSIHPIVTECPFHSKPGAQQ